MYVGVQECMCTNVDLLKCRDWLIYVLVSNNSFAKMQMIMSACVWVVSSIFERMYTYLMLSYCSLLCRVN